MKFRDFLKYILWVLAAVTIIAFVGHGIFPDEESFIAVLFTSVPLMLFFTLLFEVSIKTSVYTTTYNNENTSYTPNYTVFDELYSIQDYYDYIEKNKIALERFLRPQSKKSIIILANKYVVLTLDIKHFYAEDVDLKIFDKISKKDVTLALSFIKHPPKSIWWLFQHLCEKFDYETKDIDIENLLERFGIRHFVLNAKEYKNLSFDINKLSEAELTAIPGVTIARAKHAVKVRKKTKFLTMNQFYKAINLEEEFIEQIPYKGNKIILNELPEYKMLEMKREMK